MKYRILTFTLNIAVLFLLFQLNCSNNQDGLPEDVEKVIQERVKKGIYPSVVVGIIDGNGPRYYSYGKTTLTGNEMPDEHTVYEIGSITKTFTAIMIADMVSKGELNLDDPVSKYLPKDVNMPSYKGNAITLAHLLTHTSGLPNKPDNADSDDLNNPWEDYTAKKLFTYLSTYTLEKEPGHSFKYSSIGYNLLGYIIASCKGMRYEDLVIHTIGKPLGLDETRVEPTRKMQNRSAKGTDGFREVQNYDSPFLPGSGGLRSTAHDMLRFVAANMGFQKNPLLSAMKKTYEKSGVIMGGNYQTGYGWLNRVYKDKEFAWHTGGTHGYVSFAGFKKGGTTGVVVFTNTLADVDDIGFHLIDSTIPMQHLELPERAVFWRDYYPEQKEIDDCEPSIIEIVKQTTSDLFTGTKCPDHYTPEIFKQLLLEPSSETIRIANKYYEKLISVHPVYRKQVGNIRIYRFIIRFKKAIVLTRYNFNNENKILDAALEYREQKHTKGIKYFNWD